VLRHQIALACLDRFENSSASIGLSRGRKPDLRFLGCCVKNTTDPPGSFFMDLVDNAAQEGVKQASWAASFLRHCFI
jgi:hypothetical protein